MAQTPTKHSDDVPDEKTAVRIAEAVLLAQYGEERVNAQLPLDDDGSNSDHWIVQGHGPGPATSKGGGSAVWINPGLRLSENRGSHEVVQLILTIRLEELWLRHKTASSRTVSHPRT